MTSTRTEQISTDGGTFAGHVALPDSGSGPGVLLLQEIFGVNDYIRSVAARLAAAGYVAMAPDLFWRLEPGVEINTTGDEALTEGVGYAGRFDNEAGITDLAASLAHLRSLPEVSGKVAAMGFCFGGTMAFLAAANLDPDCAVSYYGSGVAGAIGLAPQVTCPLLLHFGDNDPFLPNSDVETIVSATESMPNVEVRVATGAGHAFDNFMHPGFSNPEAAAGAWERTAAFLAEHLGT